VNEGRWPWWRVILVVLLMFLLWMLLTKQAKIKKKVVSHVEFEVK